MPFLFAGSLSKGLISFPAEMTKAKKELEERERGKMGCLPQQE